MEQKKKKRGRPQIEIDKLEFEKMCEHQATKKDIADTFDVSEDTIERWCKRTYGKNFAVVFDQKRVKGLNSLRRKQYEIAMAGDKTMLIWLGRNWLGQRDTVEVRADAGESTIEQIAKMIVGEKKEAID